MKNIFIVCCLMTYGALTAQSKWVADKAHSNINFSISHLMISEVTGNFGSFDIQAEADKEFGDPSFTATIETNSIETGNTRRNDHLKSDDFFGVETHPEMTFITTSFEKTGEKTFVLKGDFSVRGTTHPVELMGTLNGIITDKRSQKLKAGLKLTGTINRKEFEVGTKPFPIGDEVHFVINLEMSQE